MIRQIIFLIWCGLCHVHTQAANDITTVPFLPVDDLVIIEAIIDNQKGNFIVDTGAQDLFLNKKYFKGRKEYRNEQTWDINGKVSTPEFYYAKKVQIQAFEKKRMTGKVIDLSHHEKIKNIPIHGILGYAIFKNMELTFDFKNRKLTLFKLNRKGEKLGEAANLDSEPTDSFNLHMSCHIPFLIGFIGEKRLRLGIDSGSEINILNKNSVKKYQKELTYQQPLLVSGFSKKKKQVKMATLAHLEIDESIFYQLNFALMDLYIFKKQKTVKLDGLLGSEFLQNCKMSINYRTKKLYLWQTEKQQLAINKNKIIK